MKEIDMTHIFKKVPIEEMIIFNNNPTHDDIKKASKEGKVIYANKPSEQTTKEVYLLTWELKIFVVFFDLDLNDNEFKKYILNGLKSHDKNIEEYVGLQRELNSKTWFVRVNQEDDI